MKVVGELGVEPYVREISVDLLVNTPAACISSSK